MGTAGTEEGLKLVKDQGAEHVFNHRTYVCRLDGKHFILRFVSLTIQRLERC